MPREEIKDLNKFLKPFPKEVVMLVHWLRDFIWELYPQSNELIYDNYNALAVGWSPSDKVGDTFCNIAAGRTTSNVHFGFYWGSKIADPEKKLVGNGNQYRYMLVTSKEKFPALYIHKLMREAFEYSRKKMKTNLNNPTGLTITKSVSAKKRTEGTVQPAKSPGKKKVGKKMAKKKK